MPGGPWCARRRRFAGLPPMALRPRYLQFLIPAFSGKRLTKKHNRLTISANNQKGPDDGLYDRDPDPRPRTVQADGWLPAPNNGRGRLGASPLAPREARREGGQANRA